MTMAKLTDTNVKTKKKKKSVALSPSRNTSSHDTFSSPNKEKVVFFETCDAEEMRTETRKKSKKKKKLVTDDQNSSEESTYLPEVKSKKKRGSLNVPGSSEAAVSYVSTTNEPDDVSEARAGGKKPKKRKRTAQDTLLEEKTVSTAQELLKVAENGESVVKTKKRKREVDDSPVLKTAEDFGTSFWREDDSESGEDMKEEETKELRRDSVDLPVIKTEEESSGQSFSSKKEARKAKKTKNLEFLVNLMKENDEAREKRAAKRVRCKDHRCDNKSFVAVCPQLSNFNPNISKPRTRTAKFGFLEQTSSSIAWKIEIHNSSSADLFTKKGEF
jgi:hypothetical protein